MIQFFRRKAPKDQADRLRDLVRNAVPDDQPSSDNQPSDGDAGYAGPPMVVLAGSKGGVGVSTIAVGLAQAFTDRGLRSVAVDANLRQADLGHLANAPRDVDYNITDVIAGRAEASQAIVMTPSSLRLLPGDWAPNTHQQATPEGGRRLVQKLQPLGNKFDVIVVDAGAGQTPASAPLWRAARTVLLVASAEPLSVLGAYAAIKLARADNRDTDLRLLASRVPDDLQAKEVHARVAGSCQKFLGSGVPLAGWTPEGDPAPHLKLLAERLADNLTITAGRPPEAQLVGV